MSHQYSISPQSIAEIIGEQGKEKILELLTNNKKNKWDKVVKNWPKIEGLQINICGKTKEKIYFIEVKDWNKSFLT